MNPAGLRAKPFVAVIVPARNEEKYLARCLEGLLQNGYPADCFEIWVADGASTDGTGAILRDYMERHPRIKRVENPHRIQSWGMNLAVEQANPEAEFIIRVDAHAVYPADFLEGCVETAQTTGADLVVYVNDPVAETPFQFAVARAFKHPLGVGNSLYRLGKYSGFVDHGQHGCFRRDCFQRMGGYDTGLAVNEDAELSYRIRAAGGRIYLNAKLRMKYYPRSTPSGLARQYFRYGRGRAHNVRKHGKLPAFRQLLPPLWLGTVLACLGGSILWHWMLFPLLVYLLILMLCGLQTAIAEKSAGLLLRLPLALAVMHHCWAVGFWTGLADYFFEP